MTNKSVMTFFSVNEISVCLAVSVINDGPTLKQHWDKIIRYRYKDKDCHDVQIYFPT